MKTSEEIVAKVECLFMKKIKRDIKINEFIREKRKEIRSSHEFMKLCNKIVRWLRRFNHSVIFKWAGRIEETGCICGCSPHTVLGWLEQYEVPCSFDVYHKAIETDLLFYFSFFGKSSVNIHSMKIANLLNSMLSSKELDELLSRFKNNERECIINSIKEFQIKTRKQITKVYVTFEDQDSNIKWIVKDSQDRILIDGYSSSIIWARNDCKRRAMDMIETSSNCNIMF